MKYELWNLGQYGVIADTKPHLIPPEAWSDANNVRFSRNGPRRTAGDAQIFGTLEGTNQEFIFNVPGLGTSYWIYTTLEKAYVYEAGIHTEITRISGDYNAAAGRNWQGTILGGIPLINNGVDVPQYWPTLSPAAELEDITDFPANTTANVLKAFGQYLVMMDVTDNATRFSQMVWWSHKADPGTLPASWDYTDPTVDAGRTQLTDVKGGAILDALLLADELIIYKEYSIHALRIVGGNDIMLPRLLISTLGALAPKCMCSYDKGTRHFVVGADDIISHSGTREVQPLVDDKVRNRIFSDIDPTNYLNSYCFENPLTKECWFVYPQSGSEFPDRAAIWSYQYNHWTFRNFQAVSIDFGAVSDAPTGTWDSNAQMWDSSTNPWSNQSRTVGVFIDRANSVANQLDKDFAFNNDPTPRAYVERLGIAFDGKSKDGVPKASYSSQKLLTRVWPKVSGTAILDVTVGSQEFVDGPVTWAPTQQFDSTTQKYLDWTVAGRLLAIRYESTLNEPWQLEGHDLDIERISEF